jgi:hypothetical protein
VKTKLYPWQENFLKWLEENNPPYRFYFPWPGGSRLDGANWPDASPDAQLAPLEPPQPAP